jgi:hypothetical protein
MAWIAKAIHESVAVERLREAKVNDRQQMFATDVAVCGRCGQQYMIVYRIHLDEGNPHYRNVLEHKITDTCRNGVHTLDDLPLEAF